MISSSSKEAKCLNSKVNIQCAQNGVIGVQQSLRVKLEARLSKIVERDGTELPDTTREADR